MNENAGHIGIAAVSVEGALLCARIIAAEAERRFPAPLRPQVTMHSHPVAAYADALSQGDLHRVSALLTDSISRLARAGAEIAIIPANAVHIVIEEVSRRAPVPVLNLVEIVAAECGRRGFRRVGVLGVRWTMTSGLYDNPLRARGIEPLTPIEEDQESVHTIIMDELFQFRVLEESTSRLLDVVERLKARGCQAVALACTELPLALNEANCGIPVIDTTRLLAETGLTKMQGEHRGSP